MITTVTSAIIEKIKSIVDTSVFESALSFNSVTYKSFDLISSSRKSSKELYIKKKTSSLVCSEKSVSCKLETVNIEDCICRMASVSENCSAWMVPRSYLKYRFTSLSSRRAACSAETSSCDRFMSF